VVGGPTLHAVREGDGSADTERQIRGYQRQHRRQEKGNHAEDRAAERAAPGGLVDFFFQQPNTVEEDVAVHQREDDAHQQEGAGVDASGEPLALALLQVLGHQRRGEGEDRDGHQQQQVPGQDRVIGPPQPPHHRVVVDPDDPDRQEGDHECRVARPPGRELVASSVAAIAKTPSENASSRFVLMVERFDVDL